jgi:hypothetical protein
MERIAFDEVNAVDRLNQHPGFTEGLARQLQ